MYNYGGCYETCGTQGYNNGIGGIGLIIVLFILLIIVGATFCN